MSDEVDPRFCKTCGLWMGEYLACEDGGCELETWEEAARRERRARMKLKQDNLPRMETPKAVKYLACTNDDQWFYINHEGTWQSCPPPQR